MIGTIGRTFFSRKISKVHAIHLTAPDGDLLLSRNLHGQVVGAIPLTLLGINQPVKRRYKRVPL